jgi:hypothetical protein
VSGEIEAAARALHARKEAIVDGRPDGTPVEQKDLLAMFSGFDLDAKEVLGIAADQSRRGMDMLERQGAAGFRPEHILGLILLDGMALGLLIAEQRAEAARS